MIGTFAGTLLDAMEDIRKTDLTLDDYMRLLKKFWKDRKNVELNDVQIANQTDWFH